jgi:hypothetical protein
MKTVLTIGLALALCAGSLVASEAEDRAELTRIEEQMAALLVKHDPAGLEPLLAADWKLVLSEGGIMSRNQLLDALKSGKLKFTADSAEQLDIRFFADTAIVIGITNSRGTWEGEEFSGRDRFTDVFIRKNGKWLCVSTHTSNLAEGQ